MKKGMLRRFLAGLLCVSMLAMGDGTAAVYASAAEKTQTEQDIEETEPGAENTAETETAKRPEAVQEGGGAPGQETEFSEPEDAVQGGQSQAEPALGGRERSVSDAKKESALDDSEESEMTIVEAELEGVYQFGDSPADLISEKDEPAVFALADMSALEAYLYEQMLAKNTAIDVLSYGISWEEMKPVVSGVLNEHADLYFVNKRYSGVLSGEITSTLKMTYDDTFDDDAFHYAVAAAQAAVNDGMSELEKAVALHEYLVLNCEYDKENLDAGSVPAVSHTAYGTFVNRVAVCDGYALAYKYLLNQEGIECCMVTSEVINHAWNLIKLDGEWYQVDVTWDDPVWDRLGRVCHDNMFRSDEKFDAYNGNNKHEGGIVTKGSVAVDYKAASTKYDDAFWVESTSPLVIAGGNCYYTTFNEEKKQAEIRKNTLAGTSETSISVCEIGRWAVWNSTSFWQAAFSGLFYNNDRLWYNDTAHIYSIALDGTGRKTEFTTDITNGYIYGSALLQGKVLYTLHKDPNETGKESILDSGIAATPVIVPVESIELNANSLTLAAGEEAVLRATVTPANATDRIIVWTSSDESVAVVEDGTVTAVEAGSCTVTASVGEKSTSCSVVVKSKSDEGSDDIASGIVDEEYGQITWVIDADGKLTVEGTGDAAPSEEMRRMPWSNYSGQILSAEINVKGMTDASRMFKSCSNLSSLDLSGFDTSNVTNISSMFESCSSLVSLDLSGFDISNVTNIDGLLAYCTSLTAIYTPYNLSLPVTLPKENDTDVWYDCNGTELTQLPQNLDHSILIVKNKIPSKSAITATKLKTVYNCGDTLNTDDLRVYFHDDKGAVVSITEGYTTNADQVDMSTPGKKILEISYNGMTTEVEIIVGVFYTVTFTGTGKDDITKGTLNRVSEGEAYTFKLLKKEGYTYTVTAVMGEETITPSIDETGSSYTISNVIGNLVITINKTVNQPSEPEETIYTVSFDLRGHGTLPDLTVVSGGRIEKPADPTADGYAFTGWYREAECRTLWNFEADPVEADMTLYAGWEPVEVVYTVSFDLRGHGTLPDLTVVSGGRIEKPANPTADGYTFTGWYREAECTTPWNFETDIVEADMVLYAGWKQNASEDGRFPDILPEDLPEDGRIPEGLWIAGLKDSYLYTGKAVKPSVRVYDYDCRLKEGQDYTVSYKNNTKASESSDPSRLPAVVVKGKGNYTGTETAGFKIQAVDLNDVAAEDITTAYNKKEQKKVPVLTYNKKKLVKNKDFTVAYPDKRTDAYKAAGTYEIVLTGKGNFTGSRTVNLIITDKTLISKARVAKIPDQSYDKNEKTPKPAVSMGGVPLTEGTDYTVRYENNTEVGTAAAVLSGIGDYAGTKKVAFRITGTSLKGAAVTGIAGGGYDYTGTALEPAVTVTSGGKRLWEGTDYELSYSDNTDAGTASVTVQGINAYTGTVKKTFRIKAYDLNGSGVQTAEMEQTVKYLKGGSRARIKLVFAGRELVEGRDYTVSYRNNKAVAAETAGKRPTLTVKGKGNFKGTLTKEFTITGKALDDKESPVTLTVPDVAYVNKAGKYISRPVLTDADGKKLTAGKDYESAAVYTREDGTVLTNRDIVEEGADITVRVRGKGAYSGELETTYRITKSSFGKAKIVIPPQAYTGEAVELDETAVTVTVGGQRLTPGTDYRIVEGSYVNNVKKGTASVTIVGQGNYGGAKTVKFRIVPKRFAWRL